MTIGPHAVALANLYLRMNLLLPAAALALVGIRWVSPRLSRPLRYAQLRLIGFSLVFAALLLPLITPIRMDPRHSALSAEIWSAPTMRTAPGQLRAPQLALPFAMPQASLPLNGVMDAVELLVVAGTLTMLLRVLLDARKTIGVLRRAHLVRRIGRVRLLISDELTVPFAARMPGRAFMVLPATLLTAPADVRMAMRHEAQHHRQGDTWLIYLLQLGRACFSLNPAAHWLLRQLQEIQEFACDEALNRRCSHQPHAYCACLLRIAEGAARPFPTLRCCMAHGNAAMLTRRVAAALYRPAAHVRTSVATVLAIALLIPLLALNLAIGMPIHDLRLSQRDALALLTSQQGRDFPIELNSQVLEQLNLLLGTPDGRAFVRASLQRMKGYETPILSQLRPRALPRELLAVPLVESGYRNLPETRNPVRAAGLWQFIAPSARQYGLEVSARRDERLDIPAETSAALAMLSDMRRQFGDWRLALLAYNAGPSRVTQGIRATGSRDAWALDRAGFGNDPGYLSRTMAVALILNHPGLAD